MADNDPKFADDVITALDDTTPPEGGDGGTETNGGPYQTHGEPVPAPTPVPGGGGGGAVPNGGPYQTHSEPVPAK